jgi:hypothetical protein
MCQNMPAYEITTETPCPHIDAELLLLSTQYSQIKVSGRMLVWVFFLVLVCIARAQICKNIFIALCICAGLERGAVDH